jgi:hypothetical protein
VVNNNGVGDVYSIYHLDQEHKDAVETLDTATQACAI